jgi:hypothetical protein
MGEGEILRVGKGGQHRILCKGKGIDEHIISPYSPLVHADLYPPKHIVTQSIHPLLQTDREYSMILVQQIPWPLPTNTREEMGHEGARRVQGGG